ncbi:hypothetical protein ABE354_08920 [Brevibacillus laterosporus]|uniref:hypothetical protein n=1 Tax=Brevibacillus laterosporus TaxID=1465 RepID=UPI003D237852
MNTTDAVKEFGIRVKDDSKGTNEAFTSLGLNADKMAQTFARGGPNAQKAFTQVVAAISKVKDPVKKNTIGVQLFGTMFEDLEKDVVAAMGSARSQFDMTKETMDEVASIKYDTVGKAFQGIGRQLMTEFILPLGDIALPLLQGFGDWFGSAIPKVKGFFTSVGSAIGQGYSMVQDLFTNGFGIEIQSNLFNYAKMFGFNDSDASSFVTGVQNVFTNIMDLKNDFINAWASLLPDVSSVFDSIQNTVMEVLPVFQSVGIGVWNAATKISKAFLPIGIYLSSKLWPIFSKVFGFIANDVAPAISRGFSSMLPTFISVAGKIGSTVSSIFNVTKPIIDGLVGAFNFAFPIIKSVVVSAINGVSGVFNGLMTTLGGVLDFITGVFSGDWGKAWQGVRGIFEGVFSSLGELIKVPINAAIGVINAALQGISSISIEIPDWVPGMGGQTFGMSIPEIPMLATGAIATGPTLAMIGEGAESEAVLPLSKLDALLSSSPSTGGGGNQPVNVYFKAEVTINGGGPDMREQVRAGINDATEDFHKQMNDWNAQKARTSYAT